MHRVSQARILRETLEQAHREGIPIPFGGWYPGTGNIGWGLSLTRERKGVDCDRAGIVDLTREPDGTLRRVLCGNLLKEVLALREIGVTRPAPVVDTIPVPVLEPITAAAVAGVPGVLPPPPVRVSGD